ncbi:PREDICTED: uncharacterized protein LOC105450246 [Wasmannia auropunctata]|uniref:uncharacterized protein LOC105450246 n=1 Tax=Wasmannia auropunctata TaxID=64793 RepID=UPI0005EE0148|nr:PREDICTED: uncharacterized protein LOC105450246 [Wasmannia auropunctata]
MAAVMWQGSRSSRPAVLINRGEGFVVVGWNELAVVSCYFSPNRSVNQFRAFLAAIGDATSTLRGRPILIMGDFNARSHLWENTHPTLKGDAMATWAAVQDLRLLNKYNVATCVRPQGRSVIDLTWISPALLPSVRAWDVAVEEEALSDHRYVYLRLGKRGFPQADADLQPFSVAMSRLCNANRGLSLSRMSPMSQAPPLCPVDSPALFPWLELPRSPLSPSYCYEPGPTSRSRYPTENSARRQQELWPDARPLQAMAGKPTVARLG